MNTPILFALLSGGGAVLFFVGGILIGYVQTLPLKRKLAEEQEEHEIAVAELVTSRDQASQYRVSLERLQEENNSLNKNVQNMNRRYGKIAEEYKRLRRNFDTAELTLDQIKAQAGQSKGLQRQMEAAEVNFETLKAELNAERNHSASLEERIEILIEENTELRETSQYAQRYSEENAGLQTELAQLQQKSELLRTVEGERAALLDQLDDLKNELSEAQKQQQIALTLQSENKELSIRLEVLQQKADESEALRRENDVLHSRVNDAETVQAKCRKLENEISFMRAKGIVLEKPPAPKSLDNTEGLGVSLDQALQEICASDRSRGAALADETGLAVAGAGDMVHALAAMAGIYTSLDKQVHAIMPFGKLQRMIVSDSDELTLTISPVAMLYDKLLYLTSLTVGEGPDQSLVDALLKKLFQEEQVPG
ncbi:MAG: hypothetical protein GF398_14605 [Chitinivibrionales bacterium]|nr:hypothetical protein [Chitinivibrionales bacterium]